VKIAAGCLVRHRFDGDGGAYHYLIVHPSGRYNRKRPYSIPKGLVEEGEQPDEAALRETREETGLACRILAPLGQMQYTKSRKIVIAYLAEPLEPPPSTRLEPGDWEIDRAEFVPADEAREKLHPDQRVFIDRAVALEKS
jgi:8-oxo-dGTP diphosphatase